MVRVLPELLGNEPQQALLDFVDRLAMGEAGPVCHTKHVRIDGDRRLAERGVQDDVRGLSTYAGQRLERFARLRHFSAVIADENLCEFHDVLRLVAVEADGLDVGDEPRLAEPRDRRRRVRDAEELFGRLVDDDAPPAAAARRAIRGASLATSGSFLSNACAFAAHGCAAAALLRASAISASSS